MDPLTYDKLKAQGEAYLGEANAWALRNRRPDESLKDARKRYGELQEPATKAAIRSAMSMLSRSAPLHDLTDDDEVDALWALDHSTRRFRVRPVRPEDNWTGPEAGHLILINTQTIERLVVRGDILGCRATDSDDFASSVFALRDWVNMTVEGHA